MVECWSPKPEMWVRFLQGVLKSCLNNVNFEFNSIMSKNNLVRWYSDCASASKTDEMGLIPLRITKYIGNAVNGTCMLAIWFDSNVTIKFKKYIKCIKL